MKIIALLLVIAASASATSHEWSDLRVKWNTWLLDPFRWNSFYAIPRTLEKAVSAGWVELTGANTTWVKMYCEKDDPRFCVLFDSYGHVCGVQASILVSDVADMQSIYDMSRFNTFRRKTMWDDDWWTVTAYTVDPAIIKTGGRSDWGNVTGNKGVWLETTDGYVAIPRNVANLDSAWTKEACIKEMGTHYYYAMNESAACENAQPWALLYQDGELTGILFQAFGTVTYKSRNWYEWVPSIAIKPTIPNCPSCLPEWAAKYTVISLHIYFTSEPWNIKC